MKVYIHHTSKRGFWGDRAFLDNVIQALKQGSVAVGTSDTVIGFLADVTREGFLNLNALKKREDKPYILLLSSAEQLQNYTDAVISKPVEQLMKVCWPGPLTLILKAREQLPSYMKSNDGTIAVRVPRHKGLQYLLKTCKALFSTSANVTGCPTPSTVDDLDQQFVYAVAYIIDDKDRQITKIPSTIIDCTGNQLRIVREGAYTRDALAKIIGSPLE